MTYEVLDPKTRNYVGPFATLDDIYQFARSLPSDVARDLVVEQETGHAEPADGVLQRSYQTIVADPPWRYEQTWRKNAVERHYQSMAAAEIAAVPVGEWAADDAHLYLWVTNTMLPVAFPVIETWGFRYVTALTWHKVGGPRGIGCGWYYRGETEHCLFAVRGRLPVPPDRRERNHFTFARTPHSTKPDLFYEMVERVSPGPYLELFARRRRYGWDVWGNEAPELAVSQAVLDLDVPA